MQKLEAIIIIMFIMLSIWYLNNNVVLNVINLSSNDCVAFLTRTKTLFDIFGLEKQSMNFGLKKKTNYWIDFD